MTRRFSMEHLVDRAWSAPAWLRYLGALGLVLLDSILKTLLVPVSAGNFRLMTFYPAVILSAWFGGFGPALIAIAASVASAA